MHEVADIQQFCRDLDLKILLSSALVSLPCLVIRENYNETNVIQRNSSRGVACGYSQWSGVT